MLTPCLQDVIKNRHLKADNDYFKKTYNEFREYLYNNYPEDLSFVERLYRYYYHIEKTPTCPICGTPLKIRNFVKGYYKYCSPGCASKSAEVNDKKINTTIKHFGVNNPSQSIKVQKKKEKTSVAKYGVTHFSKSNEYKYRYKNTCIERYGTTNPMQSEDVKEKIKSSYREKYGVDWYMGTDEFKSKSRNTCIERYGTTNPMQSEDVKEKIKSNCREKYGVDNPSQVEYINEKVRNTNKQKTIDNSDIIIDVISDKNNYYNTFICKCPDPSCDKCSEKQFSIKSTVYYNRLYKHNDLCVKRSPIGSLNDTSIEHFIVDILNENNIHYVTHDRTLLNGLEVDIYIPDKNLAIECNGYYWHDSNHKPKNYHYNKFMECKSRGVQLLNVWEDQIYNHPDIVKSIILSKIGVYEERVYSRKCDIREVSPGDARIFLINNHLQGAVGSSVRLGLYYNNKLISLMTFGRGRKCLNGREEYELYRYCCERGVQVIGGASKLFSHFKQQFNPSTIISFSSNDISNGSLYKLLSFTEDNCMKGSYWYIDKKGKRYHRYTYRKDVLVKEGFDPTKTEFEIMEERGFYRIYDSGQTRWIMHNDEE